MTSMAAAPMEPSWPAPAVETASIEEVVAAAVSAPVDGALVVSAASFVVRAATVDSAVDSAAVVE